MKTFFITLIAGLFFLSCQDANQTSFPLADGVSLELANYRKSQVSNVHYELNFEIPREKTEPIPAKLVLSFSIANLDAPVYIDFKEDTSNLKSIKTNNKNTTIVHELEHIVIAPKHLKIGDNTVAIEFIAGDTSLNRNDDYLYTLLVPDRARTLFPCFDQPNIKATYQLSIVAPKDWSVLCGAPEIRKEENTNSITHYFDKTDQMSTYLFSFVAGEFNSSHQNPGAFDMNMLYRETDEDKITFSTNTIFDLHQQSLSFLENYTNFKFPFQKLDFATIPGYQYGGMEHVGAIQYKESALFLDETATENEKLRRIKLIAHETSHMWFGDLVTMDWFNDVWMKEVFANFMADKIANPAFPEVNHDLAFMTTHYPRAYREDRTKGSNPIRQELDNLKNAGSLYGSIIYSKAPIMMRQLEHVLGKKAFQKGVQEYIKTYSNGNATWNDLITIFANNTEFDVEKWSEVWVNGAGRPIFHEQIVYDSNDNIMSFTINQTAEDDSYRIWPQTFDISLVYKDSFETITVDMNTSSVELSEAVGKLKPLSIIYNSNGMGYGIFPLYNIKSEEAPKIEDDIARGYVYINSYESALNGLIEPKNLLEFYRESLAVENNVLLTNLLSGYINNLFWKYLSPEERNRYQPLLGDMLWSQLQMEMPANLKKILFSTFRSIAFSEKSKAQLYKVWHKDHIIPNLKLNQDDYTSMAESLAIFKHDDYENILETAKQSINNPDKLAELTYLLPSLSNDEKVRNKFFASLKDEKNRQKESWVLNALSNLNHPLRTNSSLSNLRASLDLLTEIQKTGDIFFPKGWLNNTIGKHTSAKAYAILNEFIDENPRLKPTLKSKLLQASDDLYRVHTLSEKEDLGPTD